MSSFDFGTAHDNYLRRWRSYEIEVWCTNKGCPSHTQPVTVTYCEEYGQGWLEPEECECGGDWTQDEPGREE